MKILRCIGLSMALVSIMMQPEIYAETHHVDINSATPVAPYTTWATAATGIQQAVDASVNGDTVLVTNGTYLLSTEINVTKDIQIESVNGPNVTIIDGGGAVRCFSLGNTHSLLNGLTITNGFTPDSGGGIYCTSTNPVVNNCTISGNSAGHGGGMFYGTANNCTIIENSASSGGGLSDGTANNCTISGNSAAGGGGIFRGTANNCTIVGNSATGGGGGIFFTTVNNCILWYNEASEGSNLFFLSFARYCSSPDVQHGVDGNITNEPMLLSASHIATNSPCRGAGNPAFSSGTDIDGQAWLNPPSIGCDESYGPGTFTGPIELALSGPTHLVAGYTGSFMASIQGAIIETQISFGDGETATNLSYIFEHTWATGGDYNVMLTAFNDSYPGGISITQTVHVVSEEASSIYVSGATGNDAADGLSWATAKQTIQAGVDVQHVVGGKVVISNGTYVVSSEISVDKEIRLLGLNGPDATIVDGGGSNRCFNLGNSPSLLSGLTITNGLTADTGGGIYCTSTSPVITNCTITGNSAIEGGGIFYGTANNCTISGNIAERNGGGMYYGVANKCTISGNSAGYGGGMAYVTANHCTISGNSAQDLGGGMYYGVANNCTISGNSAQLNGGGMSRGTANNCTISGNSAYSGGGLYDATANNCIIWYNEAPEGRNLSSTSTSYCSSPDISHGVDGNITNAPMLLSTSHIVTNSPCRAAGNPAFSSGTDIDDQAWLNPPSIGCDELYGLGTFTGSIELTLSGPTNLFLPGHPVAFTFTIQGAITETQIAFDDGETATNLFNTFEHTWATEGDYNVVLTAFNDSYPGGISVTQTVHMVTEDASIIYVSEATGNDAADGRSWGTAKQTIQAGIDAQHVVGGRVLISNGTYVVTSEISIDKEIRLFGLNGPDTTIVDGGGSNRCFNLGNSPCQLSGLTITNGFATRFGGGIYCTSRDPVVTNCTISGSSAESGGGMHYGTANNCLISGNSASFAGGGVIWSTANNCTISGNSASFGGGLRSSTGNNCMISGNSATDYGGGMHNGTANNCTITENSARNGGGLNETTATNCTISGNSADYGGGMIYGTATNCTISGNSANYGGGLYSTTANNSTISSNSASYGGGMSYGSANNCTISENSAYWDGGGMFYGTAAINCTISRNSTSFGDGGGVRSGTVNNCTISDNSSGFYGGGLSEATANNCTISGNSARFGGGGMGACIANNCMINGNLARIGGGMSFGVANNCTIIGNSASESGGGMYNGTVNNCIIWYNEGAGMNLWNTSANSCSSPNLTHGVNGNSTNTPLFVDQVAGNYHLQSNSPCINWGNNSYVNSPVDLDGNPRIVGTYVDMGAYEYQTDLGADSDNDGIPDEWERDFFGSNILPMENADEDAHSNMDEYIAGTDPTNSASFFTAASTLAEVNGTNCFVVEWMSIPDRLYRIEWATNLANGFQTVEANIEHPQNSYTDTAHTAESNGFYQVEVRLK